MGLGGKVNYFQGSFPLYYPFLALYFLTKSTGLYVTFARLRPSSPRSCSLFIVLYFLGRIDANDWFTNWYSPLYLSIAFSKWITKVSPPAISSPRVYAAACPLTQYLP